MSMLGTASILRADARALPLADAGVDLIVTSPPYFGLRSYRDGGEHYSGQLGSEPTPSEFLDALVACTREMRRVLKPTGSIWVNLGDKYDSGTSASRSNPGDRVLDGRRRAAWNAGEQRVTNGRPKSLMGIPWRYALRCIDELGLILRAEVIWSKPNGLPEAVTDRVRRSHEHWFHFALQPRYFAAVDEIREPHSNNTHARRKDASLPPKNASGIVAGVRNGYFGDTTFNPLGKVPGSVWEIPAQPLTVPAHLGVEHFAAFPVEWPRRIILGWSPADGRVLDPFGGTGTTALAAKALGRHGISVDMSGDYCRIARWRTNDPAELAKTLRVEKPVAQMDGQADLLDLLGGGA